MRDNYTIKRPVNTEGFNRDSVDVTNKINIIPSNNITMDNVDFPIKVTPVYKGKAGNTEVLYPNQNKSYKGAEAVIEQRFQKEETMNKLDKYFKRGGRFQYGGAVSFEGSLQGLNPKKQMLPLGVPPENSILINQQDLTNPEPQEPFPLLGEQPIGLTGQTREAISPIIGTPAGIQSMGLTTTPTPTTIPGTNTNTFNEFNQDYQEPYQMPNIYGGVDTETAASVLGQGIAEGDALDIISGAGKVGLSLFRNTASGYADAKNRQARAKEYAEKQRLSRSVNAGNSVFMQKGGVINKISKYFNK